MSGFLRQRFEGGGKARSDLFKRLLSSLSRKDVLEDVFPARQYGDELLGMSRRTHDTGKEQMILRPGPGDDNHYMLQGNENSIPIPRELFNKLTGGASIHTHPGGSPQPSIADMRLWGHPQGGDGKHDMLTFGMSEGARIGGSEVRRAPSLYGATRLHQTDKYPVGMYDDFGRYHQNAQDIWNDPGRLKQLGIDLGGSNEMTEETVKKMPILKYMDNNPGAVSGYWRDNDDVVKGGVTLPSLIDAYISRKGKYWKRGGFIRQKAA